MSSHSPGQVFACMGHGYVFERYFEHFGLPFCYLSSHVWPMHAYCVWLNYKIYWYIQFLSDNGFRQVPHQSWLLEELFGMPQFSLLKAKCLGKMWKENISERYFSPHDKTLYLGLYLMSNFSDVPFQKYPS